MLRGFGYSGAGERAIRALEPAMAAAGMDLYIPDYISRSGLDDSRANLRRFMQDRRLARYERAARVRLHRRRVDVQSAGRRRRPAEPRRPSSTIAVRYQERAPRIADEKLHFLTWVRYGSPVFDLARTPYPPLTASGVKVGLVVETTPTSFIRDHEQTARSYGPFRFDCDAFGQRSRRLHLRGAESRRALRALRRGLAGGALVHSHRAVLDRGQPDRPARRSASRRGRANDRAAPAAGDAAARDGRSALARSLARRGVRPNAVSIAGIAFARGAGLAFAVAPIWTREARAARPAGGRRAASSCGCSAIFSTGCSPSSKVSRARPATSTTSCPIASPTSSSWSAPATPARDLPYGVTLGWAAALAAVLTAYVRVLGGSLGVTQHFIGPMAKQHRMFTLTVATLLAAAKRSPACPPRAIRVGLAVIIAGSIVTAIRRTRRIVAEVKAR